jgi:Ca2+/Na+ antiporter
MNWGSFIILTGWFGMMFLFIQRTEIRRRLTVTLLMIFAVILTFMWAAGQNLTGVLVVALITALLLNFLFWLLIGRYNPVGSSENIRVIRMDDP